MMFERRTIAIIGATVIVLVILGAAIMVYQSDDEPDDIVSSGINYLGNGGTAADGDVTVGIESYVVADGAELFTRAGYVFTGWNTAANGSGTSYRPGDAVDADGSVRLYAQWSYELTIVWNGGSGISTDLVYELTNLEHEQVSLNGVTSLALPDSPWTTISVIKAGVDWEVDQDAVTITGTSDEGTYAISFSSNGTDGMLAVKIEWDGIEYPLVIIQYSGPVTLYVNETFTPA